MTLLAKDILIIVDDGHGLETAGKRSPDFKNGTHIKENEFNHPTKLLLIEELVYQGINVYDCSTERTDTPLDVRTNRANLKMDKTKYKLYIFISIHFNAIGHYWSDNIGGLETYHYLTSSQGKKIAELIHGQLLKGTDLKDRGVKSANFHVLRETNMFAVLLECGFMSNHIESSLMKNIAYQKECSIEITKGICEYANIKYKEKKNELETMVTLISPAYHKVWMKHMKEHSDLNWEGFLKRALKL